MKAVFATGLIAVVALAGCNATTKPIQRPSTQTAQPSAPTAQHTHNVYHFKCDNGAEPIIRVLNDSQIAFTTQLGDVNPDPTIMTIQQSASGASYVSKTGIYGKGGEWHQKGADYATFTYHDVGSPTNCRIQ